MSPYLALALAPLFWSGNFVLGKVLVREVPPFTISALRWTISALILAPMVFKGGARPRIRREHRSLVLLLGFSGIAMYNSLLYTALRETTTISATLIQTAIPLITLLLARIALRDAVTPRRWVGIASAFFGVTWIAGGGDLSRLVGLSLNRSDLIVLTGVFMWAIYTLWGQQLLRHYSPMVATFYAVLVGLAFLYPMAFFELRRTGVPPVTGSAAAILLYMGIFPGVVSYLFWYHGIAGAGAGRAAIFANLIPVYTGLIAVTFLGERIGWHHLVGALFIGAGVYMTTVLRSPSQSRPKGGEPSPGGGASLSEEDDPKPGAAGRAS